ncbi:LysR substrate-binding domain-containing protein [Cobetia amphilecti]|jgi:DNA-binding transcriptional LysR family regulator|uniref:LysR substrate-binding domain-containing protein n=3 Tax=Halomonadaceae TaxID=28256 RepID=UPI00255180EC|nr:LysR substrate-binding domain-containing protein [Cobetia amphilecti]
MLARIHAFEKRVIPMKSIGKPDTSSADAPRPLPSLDTDLLLAFVTVADSGSFTQASRHLHRTQSTVSLRISTLEERLGYRLLMRTSRHMELTNAGRTFLRYARRILQLQREAVAALSENDHPITLRLGLPEDYATTWLPELLAHLGERHPQIRPHIHCRMSTELLEQLDAGQLDLVIAVSHNQQRQGELLSREPVVWAAHQRFVLDPSAPLPLALFPEQCIYRERALSALTQAERSWRIDSTSQSPSGLRVIVNQGHAITVADRRSLPEDWCELGTEAGLPALPTAEIELHRSPSLTHPIFDTCAEMIRELLREKPQER